MVAGLQRDRADADAAAELPRVRRPRSTPSCTARRSPPTPRSPTPARAPRCSPRSGVRDALEMRRGIRERQYDNRYTNVKPLVPRYLRVGVGGRLDRNGVEVEPLSLDDIRSAIALFKQEKVEAVSICFMNAFANPAHERAAAELVRARAARRLSDGLDRAVAVDPLLRARQHHRAQLLCRPQAQPLSRSAGDAA